MSSGGGPGGSSSPSHALNHALSRLSIGTAATKAPLPPSPKVNSSRPPPSPLRRSSSTMDVHRRSESPAGLVRKSSSSSLRSERGGGGSYTERGGGPNTPIRSSSRRSSAYMVASSPASNGLGQIEEKETVTAATVAAEFFERELGMHAQSDNTTDTVVLLHDSCYGHRYSRPKTTKTTLSLIVERPERILAGALGVSAAYVRLGGRHAGGRVAPHPSRALDKNMPFRIVRTSRAVSITSPAVTNVHGTKWMEELRTMCESAATKLATTGKELSRAESGVASGQPRKEQLHEGDLYLCSESLNAFQGALGGVLDGVDAVFEGTETKRGPSRAFVCIRPPGHHCSADYPSGFCWINNVHVGIQHAAATHGLTHAAIIDFDLHHGDGSQTITWAHNAKVAKMPKSTANHKKTAIGYFSLHDINSYPCEYGEIEKVQNASLCIENAHGQSIWNVHLQPWKTEADFWDLYETRYKVLLDKTRAFLRTHTERLQNGANQPVPKSAIFISAGFDASEWESQGMQRHKVNVPTEFYARFTKDIAQLAREEGTGAAGRVVSVLEGGYSDRALTSGVLSHISGLCEGQTVAVKEAHAQMKGLGYEMSQRMDSMHLDENQIKGETVVKSQYDVDWWKADVLSELELLVNPTPVATAPKKRAGGPSTFAAPTQSFKAKVVDPSKVHRSSSGTFHQSASPSRAPTPPPPEVDWATAAHELSKLIIPGDRQTTSCKPEELNEPRVKKDKPAPAPVAAPDPSGRQLRGRKAAKPARYTEPETDEDDAKSVISSVSNADRRRTIATIPMEGSAETKRRTSRRLSVASSVGTTSGDKSIRAPSTSGASSRTTSTVPSRAPSVGGIAVKKRTSTASKASESSGTAVPRVPSGYASKAKPQVPLSSQANSGDVEALTKGLKKITLKLPPKEEYEARQREKEAAEKEKAKRPIGRPPVKRTTTGSKIATAKKTDVPPKKAQYSEPARPPIPPGSGPPPMSTTTATATEPPAEPLTSKPPLQATDQPIPPQVAEQPLPPLPTPTLQISPPPPGLKDFTPITSPMLPPLDIEQPTGAASGSPSNKGKELPTFSANGVIPFGTAEPSNGQT